MSKDSPRKPDFILAALLKGKTQEESRMANNLGAAWVNPDGSIRIKLDPFVVLEGSEDRLVLTLFPRAD